MQELMHGNLEDMTAKEQERGAKLIASMAKNVTDLASQIDDDIMAYDGRERNVRTAVLFDQRGRGRLRRGSLPPEFWKVRP